MFLLRGGGGGGGLTPPPPLQISIVEGPIGIRIGTDIEKHINSIAAYFSYLQLKSFI